MIPPVRTPLSTAALMEPCLRIVLSARISCSCPCSTPRPIARSTPRLVPFSDDSMSWVASALPANSTSTKPALPNATWHVTQPPSPGRRRCARRPGPDPEHELAGGLGLAHAVGDLPDQHCLRLLARHVGLHEPEGFTALVDDRDGDLDAGGASDHLHADLHVRHGQRVDALRVDDEATVHLWVLDVEPLAAEPDLCRQVGGGVEAVGEDTVQVGNAGRRLARIDLVDASGLQPHQQALERLIVLCSDDDVARLVSVASWPTSKRSMT